jgi:hypothetical protein
MSGSNNRNQGLGDSGKSAVRRGGVKRIFLCICVDTCIKSLQLLEKEEGDERT